MSHDTNFYTWTQNQAQLLRQGRLGELDITNLIDEMEDIGRSERIELESRLAVLLAHLLKWHYQPERQGKSWLLTIKMQRKLVKKVLQQNPGLQYSLIEILDDSYFYFVRLDFRRAQ